MRHLFAFVVSALVGVSVGIAGSARATPSCLRAEAVGDLAHVRTTIDGAVAAPGPDAWVQVVRDRDGHRATGSYASRGLLRPSGHISFTPDGGR